MPASVIDASKDSTTGFAKLAKSVSATASVAEPNEAATDAKPPLSVRVAACMSVLAICSPRKKKKKKKKDDIHRNCQTESCSALSASEAAPGTFAPLATSMPLVKSCVLPETAENAPLVPGADCPICNIGFP